LLRTRGGCIPCTSWGLELELAKRAVHILAGDIGGRNAHLVLGEAAAAEPLVVVIVSMGTGARTGWFPKCIARTTNSYPFHNSSCHSSLYRQTVVDTPLLCASSRRAVSLATE
jgi:hypothetical protein